MTIKALIKAVQDRLRPIVGNGANEVILRGAKYPEEPSIIIEPPESESEETLDFYRTEDVVLSIRIQTIHPTGQINYELVLDLVQQVKEELRGIINVDGYDLYFAPPSTTNQTLEHEDRTELAAVVTYPSLRFPNN